MAFAEFILSTPTRPPECAPVVETFWRRASAHSRDCGAKVRGAGYENFRSDIAGELSNEGISLG
jgi:hypothetical protein